MQNYVTNLYLNGTCSFAAFGRSCAPGDMYARLVTPIATY